MLPAPYHPFFVYGTLMPGQENDYFWQGHIIHQRPAVFPGGRLYSFDAFPMLIEDARAERAIRGMVVEVDPHFYDGILTTIDQLEEYDPADETHSIYRRCLRSVRCQDGTKINAWVYLGRKELVKGQPLISGGDWLAFQEKNPFSTWWRENGFRLISGQNLDSDS